MAVAVTRALGQSGGGARSSFGADPRGKAAVAGLGKVDRSTGGGVEGVPPAGHPEDTGSRIPEVGVRGGWVGGKEGGWALGRMH